MAGLKQKFSTRGLVGMVRTNVVSSLDWYIHIDATTSSTACGRPTMARIVTPASFSSHLRRVLSSMVCCVVSYSHDHVVNVVLMRPGKHVQFGEIVDGEEVLAMIEKVKTLPAENNKPAVPVIIADCGLLLD